MTQDAEGGLTQSAGGDASGSLKSRDPGSKWRRVRRRILFRVIRAID
jgi:predicted RNase H-like HicB family nuclease